MADMEMMSCGKDTVQILERTIHGKKAKSLKKAVTPEKSRSLKKAGNPEKAESIRCTAEASFTLEAALVMPVVLFCIVSMIIYGFGLHDIVVCNAAANEAAELMSHMSDAQGRDGIEDYINRKTGNLQAGEYRLSVEEYKDGSRISVFSDKGEREYEDEGMRPEKLMRKLTVLEMIFVEEE